jgi:hypothetical protein
MLEREYGPQLGGFKELREQKVVKLTTTLMQQRNRSSFFKNIDSIATIDNRLMLMMANLFFSRKYDS